MITPSYFEVRGSRAIYRGDVRTGVTRESFLRFSCVAQRDAELFATDVYRREGIVCTIDEIARAS